MSELVETEGCRVRVVTIYSLPWRYRGKSRRNLTEELDLSKLRQHYELYREQLPRLLPDKFIGGTEVAKSIELDESLSDEIVITESNSLLFALPSNQVVLAVVLCFTTRTAERPDEVQAISNVLEQTIEGSLTFKRQGASLAKHVSSLLSGQSDSDWEQKQGDSPLQPERHQLVFIARRSTSEEVPDSEAVNEIVYRNNPPYREEFGQPHDPAQLNLLEHGRKLTLGIVTPYVSLLYGHERYVEDSIFLSTVHAVGTASTFRQIWHDSYTEVRSFRENGQAKEAGAQTRAALERLADNLGNLEFDLTFSVEFPLIRIEAFHSALYEAMDLSGQARALSQMFGQLAGSLRSEITAIDARERRTDERRHRWNAFAAGVLSLIGVSVGFVIAFLGINTTEVSSGDRAVSMWDPKFTTVYLVASLFALIPVFFILFPYLRDWVDKCHNRRPPRPRWPIWAGMSGVLAGIALFFGAILVDSIAGSKLVTGAIMKSISVLGVLAGLSLLSLHLGKRWQAIRERAVKLFRRRRSSTMKRSAMP